MTTIVQAVPLIRRAECRAYLLMAGASLLFTLITENVLVIHHIPTGAVQCIAYKDLARLTETGVEEAMKHFTPPQVDGPHMPTDGPTKRPSKRTKSSAVA